MIILASKSPRRKELLSLAGYEFNIDSADVEEIHSHIEDVYEKAMYLAKIKAQALISKYPNDTIIGADTIVVKDNVVFGKPSNKGEAESMLRNYSNTTHSVITGVCIIKNGNIHTFYSETYVEFYNLSDKEILDYINTEDPYDKAGGYGIQTIGHRFVKSINGDFYNVVGFPISKVVKYLEQ